MKPFGADARWRRYGDNCGCLVFYCLIAALGLCVRAALRSSKAIGRPVALLLTALIPPLIGNSIIIISGNKALSTVGYYTHSNLKFFRLRASFSLWLCFGRPALLRYAEARVSADNPRIARPQPRFSRRFSGQRSAAFPQPQRSQRSTGELAPFRLISPPMKFPPQAVIGGLSSLHSALPEQKIHPESWNHFRFDLV